MPPLFSWCYRIFSTLFLFLTFASHLNRLLSFTYSRIINILSTLYPVGGVYIGTQSTCPLATLISGSKWELVSSGRVLQGADSGHSAGTTIEAGLPNITGYVISSGAIINTHSYPAASNGALYLYGGGYKNCSMGSSNNTSGVGIDASRSSSIYGNSNTVQPPAYVVNIWKRTA